MATHTRDHVRRPDLPWRQSTMTECGRQISDVAGFISRQEAIARIKKDGIQRASYSLCMTCLNTAQTHGHIDPDLDPADFAEALRTRGPSDDDNADQPVVDAPLPA